MPDRPGMFVVAPSLLNWVLLCQTFADGEESLLDSLQGLWRLIAADWWRLTAKSRETGRLSKHWWLFLCFFSSCRTANPIPYWKWKKSTNSTKVYSAIKTINSHFRYRIRSCWGKWRCSQCSHDRFVKSIINVYKIIKW